MHIFVDMVDIVDTVDMVDIKVDVDIVDNSGRKPMKLGKLLHFGKDWMRGNPQVDLRVTQLAVLFAYRSTE